MCIRDRLQRERPAHAVAGEEFGTSGDAAMRWYIDPIDGTKNFARGIPVWATLIALYDGDIPVCGVVSAPALHARWWAAAGAGATSSHRGALQVSTVRELAAAGVSCSDIREFEQHGFGSGFATLSQGCAHVRAFGDFWSHMLVAEGALELGVEPVVNAWDVAPIRCIVEEAGGVFTDLQGRRDITGGSVLTSNGVLHQAALQLLANTITR